MIKEAIEQTLVAADWEVDGGFSGHLLIGNAGDLSILTPWWAWRGADPECELYDVQRNLVCQVESGADAHSSQEADRGARRIRLRRRSRRRVTCSLCAKVAGKEVYLYATRFGD